MVEEKYSPLERTVEERYSPSDGTVERDISDGMAEECSGKAYDTQAKKLHVTLPSSDAFPMADFFVNLIFTRVR